MRLIISPQQIVWLKFVIHLSALVPLIWMFYLAFTDNLGADPVEELLHFTGISAFNLLLISLTVSPLARFLRASQLVRTRRLLGLYSFTYALAHFASYILFELQLEWSLLVSEIIKRPYITVGFVAFVILLIMTATSTTRIQKYLGKRWQSIHNFVYLAGGLVALHFIWSVKSDIIEPLIYWALLLILLSFRRDKFKRLIKKR